MAAKAKSAEATIESFTNMSNTTVKENVERAMATFNELGSFSKENVEALVASMTEAGKGAEAINQTILAYAKASMEDGVATAKKMAAVRSVQELVELQTDYAKSSLETYMSEVNKITEAYSATMKDAFKPLNERVSAAVELVQTQR